MLERTSRLVVLGLCVSALSALATGCAADASETETNADAHKVLVYSNNVENMIFDWKDLLSYMKTQASRPDIFLVQQMTDRAHLDEMTTAMTNVLGVSYSGRVAQDHPTNLRQSTEVSPRPTVTTGIIFRGARFSVLSEELWLEHARV
jgi:ABC-type oligopeptide transport system substrate-binding subunit